MVEWGGEPGIHFIQFPDINIYFTDHISLSYLGFVFCFTSLSAVGSSELCVFIFYCNFYHKMKFI